ncbi:transmembrane protein 125 [Myripristis murdjan]|uniref:transmembrane protein 125 n=1 Tax=Myripristis murdjan TaxID=586833 RepID=UPI0011763FE6|nr:transmembrane protein 125-like [Myripristis murdjan]
MPEVQAFYPHRHTFLRPPSLQLDPALMQRRVLEDQVELWWFREPRRSLLCYSISVSLVLGLGLGGVGLLSTTTSLSGEWRLGVGTTLCLLALAVLLKQLLSSAVQDMNCVRSRRRIDQLKSGGWVDPVLILVVGLGLLLCGSVLLYVATASSRPSQGQDKRDMLLSGLVLMAAGGGMALAIVGYIGLIYLQQRGEERRREMIRRRRARRLGSRAVRVFSISARQMAPSNRTSLI